MLFRSDAQTYEYQIYFFDYLSLDNKPSIKSAQLRAYRKVQNIIYARKKYTKDTRPERVELNTRASARLKSFTQFNSLYIKLFEEKNGWCSFAGGLNTNNGQFEKNMAECKKRGYDAAQTLVYQKTYLELAAYQTPNKSFNKPEAEATIAAQAAYGEVLDLQF